MVRIDGTIDSDVHTETARYYYHTDHLGTIEAVTDASGTEVWSANYSAFGEVLATSGSLDQEPVYTGKSYDEEVGLYYFNARWYDPELGRFTSEDPIQDGVNWYIYVSNNPLKFVDPTGLDPSYAGMSTKDVNEYYSGDDSDEGDGDNDNGGSGNNTTGQTPAPEPEKKNAWEAFKDFLGGFFGRGDDEDGKVPGYNDIDHIVTADDYLLKIMRDLIAQTGDKVLGALLDDSLNPNAKNHVEAYRYVERKAAQLKEEFDKLGIDPDKLEKGTRLIFTGDFVHDLLYSEGGKRDAVSALLGERRIQVDRYIRAGHDYAALGLELPIPILSVTAQIVGGFDPSQAIGEGYASVEDTLLGMGENVMDAIDSRVKIFEIDDWMEKK
ncbi:RHS repeat-associated core domain-containing protein [Marispirochaeta sp.]|uniref:RHS repeat domain-containing protein n=1 Tax=Marispirochaeta sp. TaxID=2038653 RepID=UPI0029C6C79F|nr:RHS repeat-associated core domain-containing protein [Marispirochaeta sp.]